MNIAMINLGYNQGLVSNLKHFWTSLCSLWLLTILLFLLFQPHILGSISDSYWINLLQHTSMQTLYVWEYDYVNAQVKIIYLCIGRFKWSIWLTWTSSTVTIDTKMCIDCTMHIHQQLWVVGHKYNFMIQLESWSMVGARGSIFVVRQEIEFSAKYCHATPMIINRYY